MATIEEILAGTDARFYDGRDPSQVFSSPFKSGVNQNIVNLGILGTDQAQNMLDPNIVSAERIDAQTADEQAQLPIAPIDK